MTDTLRIESNERIDLIDFNDLVHGIQVDAQRELADNFLTDPESLFSRSWIIDGFGMDCPAGKQLRVTLGRAIVPYRLSGEIKYGMLSVDGDATKIIDIAAYGVGAYGIYVRFNFVDGTEQSRVFWDASAAEEITQTINTRHLATWEMRIESGTPGPEWFQIGGVDQATLAPPNTGITDQRLFYFEGDPNAAYGSGWSSDGGAGGAATDRNADRQQYGVKDLQTFTRAMRQCLEDIKGRGLRRWYERDIGGMNLGFDAAPVEDRLALGSAEFYLDGSGDPVIMFVDADTDVMYYDVAADQLNIEIAGVQSHQFDADYYAIGSTSTFGLNYNAGVRPSAFFAGLGDALAYDRGADQFEFDIAAATIAVLDEVKLQTKGGIVAGDAAMALAGAIDRIILVDANFMMLNNGLAPSLTFDATDYLNYTRATDLFSFVIGGLAVATVADLGVAVNKGLYVGSSAGVPLDNDIVADGGIRCGAGYAANPGDGEGIFKGGISIANDASPTVAHEISWGANDNIRHFASVLQLRAGGAVGVYQDSTAFYPENAASHDLGKIANAWDSIYGRSVIGYGSNGRLMVWDTTPVDADQEKFVIEGDGDDVMMRFYDAAEVGTGDILKFVRGAGELLSYIEAQGNLYPADVGLTELGDATNYWGAIRGLEMRAKMNAAPVGEALFVTYTGTTDSVTGGGACNATARLASPGGANTGWVKFFVGAAVFWIPFWADAVA